MDNGYDDLETCKKVNSKIKQLFKSNIYSFKYYPIGRHRMKK